MSPFTRRAFLGATALAIAGCTAAENPLVRPTDPGTAPLKLDARDPNTINQVVRLRVTLPGEGDGFWAHVRDVARANQGAFTIATADLREALDGKGVHLRDPGFVAMLGVADAAKLGWKVERTAAGDGFEFTPNP